jgi:hypothetical protein
MGRYLFPFTGRRIGATIRVDCPNCLGVANQRQSGAGNRACRRAFQPDGHLKGGLQPGLAAPLLLRHGATDALNYAETIRRRRAWA